MLGKDYWPKFLHPYCLVNIIYLYVMPDYTQISRGPLSSELYIRIHIYTYEISLVVTVKMGPEIQLFDQHSSRPGYS
jgi:hypothetical protein